jgi:TolB-like protein/tetratricopeptide (TPR) repeat protein
MADVFLSYKREDAARVRKLAAALQQAGLEVWWDDLIAPGQPWEATIERALANAKAVVVCWTPVSIASENVRSEARVARADGRLIQVFLKTCSAPLFFGERQGIDLTKWRGNVDDAHVRSLADLVRRLDAGEQIGGLQPPTTIAKRRSYGRFLLIAAIALVVASAATFIGWRAAMARPAPEIAVIPFEDLSPTHDKAFFAEGIAEEILSSLSADRQLKVLGRTSARQIDRSAAPRSIRKSLGVTHLLEGSARAAGDALRVNVRLIDTEDGSTIWQQEYQGRVSEVFSMQDRIAAAVARQVRGMFESGGGVRNRPVTSAEAYQMYLQARTLMRIRSRPTLERAFGLAQRVISAQPDYAPGQALFAELVMHLSNDPLEYGDIPVDRAMRIGHAHSLKAIQLAPNIADGYASFGLVTRGPEAVAALKRAIVLDPSRADARFWLEEAYSRLGDYDSAYLSAKAAAELEPLWPTSVNRLVSVLASSRHFDEASAVVDRFAAMGGNRAQVLKFRETVARRRGDHAKVIGYGEQALKLDPTLPYVRDTVASSYRLLGVSDGVAGIVRPETPLIRRLFLENQRGLIVEQARSAGAKLLGSPDIDVIIFSLGAAREWGPLAQIYLNSGMAPASFCAKLADMSFPVGVSLPVVQALQATGRSSEARALLSCVRDRTDHTFAQAFRSADSGAGESEAARSMVLALSGDRDGALLWLQRAFNFGWIGSPYSAQLVDWPEFDSIRSDPRLAALQSRIDQRVSQFRNQVLAARKNSTI